MIQQDVTLSCVATGGNRGVPASSPQQMRPCASNKSFAYISCLQGVHSTAGGLCSICRAGAQLRLSVA